MKKLFLSVLSLLVIGLVACSGSSEDVTQISSATTTPSATGFPTPPDLATPAIEPRGKVLPNPHTAPETTQFSAAPDSDLFRLTKELVLGTADIPWVVTGDTSEYQVGRTDTFWLVDQAGPKTYQSEFELILVTPHAYWYVENGLDVSLSGIERSASVFEEDIYPVVTGIFGSEWNPGIDNDSHLNILNAKLSGVAGYYSSTDEYPTSVRPKSNQREMIYINAENVPPGEPNYDQVLAHELQHAIHWNVDASEDTWINEGLAELSSSIALNSTFSIRHFLRSSPISLINWPTSSVGGIANYGASSLFMHFFSEHYGGHDGLRILVAQPEDSIAGINAYLEDMGYESRFDDVFREWAAANFLDGEGILGYQDLEVSATARGRIRGFNESHSEVPQYSVEYTELLPTSEPFSLSFEGSTTAPLLPVDVGASGCWWGNAGDSIDATLARQVRLPTGSTATLDYEVWFEIEEDWDYLYVEVSEDDGQTWRIMETPVTSPENPIGNSFGPGYTGHSDGWVKESIGLSAHAGKDIQVRFQYVTDDAVNAIGACIRNLSIGAAGIEADDQNWESNGFIFTNNLVRQRFQVQLITSGNEPQVQQITLESDNSAEIVLEPPAEGQKLIVAVGALAEKTREPANYTLTVTPAN